jgi:hypothetical protein
MILRPLAAPPLAPAAACSAWEAVAATQQQKAAAWRLITQPEHARLSGEMAAAMHLPALAPLPPGALRGIALHDEGWGPLDAEALAAGTLPRSFLHATPEEAGRAWKDSIELAAQDSPLAGYLVSRHFWRLGSELGEAAAQNDAQRALVRAFLAREEARQQKLLAESGLGRAQAERLVDLLQFCDLLSLYLCCGSREAVIFPQGFDGTPLRLRWRDDDDACLLDPSLFPAPLRLETKAAHFPAQAEPATLHWELH